MKKGERKSQLERCIALATALAPHIVAGLSVGELGARCGLSAPVVCRDMAALAALGWAQRLDNGRWSLTTRPIALAEACALALKTAHERQEDFRHNVKAGAYRLLGE